MPNGEPSHRELYEMEARANEEKYGIRKSNLNIATIVARALWQFVNGTLTRNEICERFDPSVVKWLGEQDRLDETKCVREARDAARDVLRETALSKLTAEEREALGIREIE